MLRKLIKVHAQKLSTIIIIIILLLLIVRNNYSSHVLHAKVKIYSLIFNLRM